MQWSKLKTIILLMLVGVNLFLLALVGLRAGQGAYYEDETRQTTIQVLERGGITFVPEELPEDISLPVLALTRNRESEKNVAQALLGTVTQTSESGVRPSYTGPKGTAEFSMNGAFIVTFTDGSWQRQPGQSVSDASRNCLEQIGFQAMEEEVLTQGDTTWATYCQVWEDAPVFSCQVTLTWEGESLVRMEGSRLDGTSTPSAQSLLSTPTVLMRFLAGVSQNGYVCSQITDMEPGYLTSGSSRSVQLTPVWRIDTDTGSYYVDAVSGLVTAET